MSETLISPFILIHSDLISTLTLALFWSLFPFESIHYAQVCWWLGTNGLACHVSYNGTIKIRLKTITRKIANDNQDHSISRVSIISLKALNARRTVWNETREKRKKIYGDLETGSIKGLIFHWCSLFVSRCVFPRYDRFILSM